MNTGMTLDEIRDAIRKVALKLSIPHKRFADEWLANGNNGTKAYLAIFNTNKPAVAGTGAHKLLRRSDIKSYIDLCKQFTTDELLNHLAVTKNRIMDEEAKLAFIDIRKMFDVEGNFLPPHLWPEEIARAAAGVEIDKKWDSEQNKWQYKYRIKLNDKGRALKRLEDCLGMTKAPELTDKHADVFKGFLHAIDGETRGKLPSELEDDDD